MKRLQFIRLLQILCVALFALSFASSANAGEEGWAEKSAFVGPETVAVGCGAGLSAGIFAGVLPAIWTLPGQSSAVSLPVTTAWGLIGCGVGVVAATAAVLMQASLDAWRM
jgi:hypothetical protein